MRIKLTAPPKEQYPFSEWGWLTPAKARRSSYEMPRAWFAWRPVMVEGVVVWLETVSRRRWYRDGRRLGYNVYSI